VSAVADKGFGHFMLNIYEQVKRNKFKSNLVIFLFVGFILTTVYLLIYAFNLDSELIWLAFFFSLISSFVSYYWGDKIVLSLNGARPASREEFFDFYTVTENLAQAYDLPNPKIYVIDSGAPNAFATGRDPEHSLVCATTGLLTKLNRTELEGVIGHELSHIKNYDIRLMMIVSLLVGSLSTLINLAYRSRHRSDRDDDRSRNGILVLVGLLLIIFAPLIAQLIQLAISRRREYLADAAAVKLTRQPQGLISALQKIAQDPTPLESASTATASLYISNPFKTNKIASLFSTHPPLEDRIKTLQEML
jgi:heat shock protein HtpX